MTLCEDDAKLTGPISLFLGVETFGWGSQQFIDAINFCKQHHVSTVFLKVFEVANNNSYWYGGLSGIDAIIQKIQQSGITVIPYGFVYGNYYQMLQTEINCASTILQKYGKLCLDMEQTYWAQSSSASWAKSFSDALSPIPGKLWISCPANPIESGQLPFLQAIAPATNIWAPMVYNNYLSTKWVGDFNQLNPDACIQPTLDLSQEFGPNDVLRIVQSFKDKGILAFSCWEYQFAVSNPSLLDQIVKMFGGQAVSKPWYMYDIVVPFGNPNYDAGLGGAHDMDVAPPPNCPVTALLPGKIVDLSAPSWGKQVGIQLDNAVNGVPYMAYLHLSAINPSLSIGKHVSIGDTIGWTGGATSQDQYKGTSNPTGQNFLNDPSMSSQIQVGIALMNGPVYGSDGGWENWPTNPPVWHDGSPLDPTPILENARKAYQPVDNPNQDQAALDMWNSNFTMLIGVLKLLNVPMPSTLPQTFPPIGTGIYNAWLADYKNSVFHGPPTSIEYSTINWRKQSIVAQNFFGGRYEWDGSPHWYSFS